MGTGKGLQFFRYASLRYWAGTRNHRRQLNRLPRQIRIRAAQREFSRGNVGRFLAPVYGCVSHANGRCRYGNTVAHVWYKSDDGLWWLGKINATTQTDGVYLFRGLDDPGPIKLPLPPAYYTTLTRAVRNSCFLQINLTSVLARGVQRNVDEYRGAAVDSWLSLLDCP